MCDISSDIIDQEYFACSDPASLHMTYRARLSGTPETDSHILITYMEKWVSGGPNINVQGVIMRIDSDCEVVIASFNDDLCTNAPTIDGESIATDNETSTTVSPSSQCSCDSDNTAVIIGGGGVAVVLIMVVAIVIITLALIWKSRHGEYLVKKTKE